MGKLKPGGEGVAKNFTPGCVDAMGSFEGDEPHTRTRTLIYLFCSKSEAAELLFHRITNRPGDSEVLAGEDCVPQEPEEVIADRESCESPIEGFAGYLVDWTCRRLDEGMNLADISQNIFGIGADQLESLGLNEPERRLQLERKLQLVSIMGEETDGLGISLLGCDWSQVKSQDLGEFWQIILNNVDTFAITDLYQRFINEAILPEYQFLMEEEQEYKANSFLERGLWRIFGITVLEALKNPQILSRREENEGPKVLPREKLEAFYDLVQILRGKTRVDSSDWGVQDWAYTEVGMSLAEQRGLYPFSGISDQDDEVIKFFRQFDDDSLKHLEASVREFADVMHHEQQVLIMNELINYLFYHSSYVPVVFQEPNPQLFDVFENYREGIYSQYDFEYCDENGRYTSGYVQIVPGELSIGEGVVSGNYVFIQLKDRLVLAGFSLADRVNNWIIDNAALFTESLIRAKPARVRDTVDPSLL
jgi:hypothetical protein